MMAETGEGDAKVTRGIPFGTGNKAAAGNHNSKRAARFRELLSEEIDEEKTRALIRKLYERAMATPEEGQADIAAARELLDRMVGKAPQSMEVTGPDGGAIQVVRYVREEPKPAEPAK
jgi:hypothetical protein